MFAYRPWWSG
jgi:hypothetical protein